MFEFVTQHQLAILLVLALAIPLSSCAMHYTVHPGALNQTDSVAYDALLIAEATIDQARQFPLDDEEATAALDTLIKSYNLARESWLTYRGAISTNVPQQEYLDKLNQNLSDLSNAIKAFQEAK
jgi:hypothetical protein